MDQYNKEYNKDDPCELFQIWYNEAQEQEKLEPNAMSLATIGENGYPNVRIVLLKEFSQGDFIFYTNLNSTKGKELLSNPKACLCFHWKSLEKQVRISGDISRISDQKADSYFASRPRLSRIGAWASKQSEPLNSQFEFEKQIAYYSMKFSVGEIPRPPHWHGFCLTALNIEFWQAGSYRLHKRIFYQRKDKNSRWQSINLYP